MACNERYGSGFGVQLGGGRVGAPLSGELLLYTMSDRRWSLTGGAPEASLEFAMELARCIDEIQQAGTITNHVNWKDNGYPVRASEAWSGELFDASKGEQPRPKTQCVPSNHVTPLVRCK